MYPIGYNTATKRTFFSLKKGTTVATNQNQKKRKIPNNAKKNISNTIIHEAYNYISSKYYYCARNYIAEATFTIQKEDSKARYSW